MEVVAALRSALAQKVGQERYELWFGSNTELALYPDKLVISAPNQFFQEWLRRNFRLDIEAAGQQILGRRVPLEFRVEAALEVRDRPAPPVDASPAPLAAAAPPSASPDVTKPAAGRRRFARLDGFVVGNANRLAFTAAQLAAQSLGSYSPLVIHGPTGVGKTHLLEGIWSAVRRNRPETAAVFLSAEQFTSYFLEALRGGGLPNFRRKYRGVELLIIDDVQFFAGKRATLVELLHTMNTLLDEGRQLVFAADRAAAELNDLGRELVDRLTGGMVCRIDPPDYEVRLGIVGQLARQMGLDLPDVVAEYVATNLTSHARELAGALHRLHAGWLALGHSITLASAQEALSEMIRHNGRALLLRDIEKAVCHVFGLEQATLQSARRSKQVSQPRMLAMWLARKHTRAALSEIGHFFGGRSHSTVISAQKRVGAWMSQQELLHLADGKCSIDEAIRRVERNLLAG